MSDLAGCLVLAVHQDVDDKEDEAHNEQKGSNEEGAGDACLLGDERTEADGRGCAQTSHRHLNAHSRG